MATKLTISTLCLVEQTRATVLNIKHHWHNKVDSLFLFTVHGGWGQWYPWQGCDVTCGNGTRVRLRTCTNPKPANGGQYCSDEPIDSGICILSACAGILQCLIYVGFKSLVKSRHLLMPHLNDICLLSVDGNWAEWNRWSGCDASCNTGQRYRNRSCTDPPPQHGGLDCSGNETDTKDCNTQPCPSMGMSMFLWDLPFCSY